MRWASCVVATWLCIGIPIAFADDASVSPLLVGGALSTLQLSLQSIAINSAKGGGPVDVTTSTGREFIFSPNAAGSPSCNGVLYVAGHSPTHQNAEFDAFPTCEGASSNSAISFRGRGNWFFAFHSTPEGPSRVALYAQADDSHPVVISGPRFVPKMGIVFALPGNPRERGAFLYDETGNGDLAFGAAIRIPQALVKFDGESGKLKTGEGIKDVEHSKTGTYLITLSQPMSNDDAIILANADSVNSPIVVTAHQVSRDTIVVVAYTLGGKTIDPKSIFVSVYD